jgi:hypothetical protein
MDNEENQKQVSHFPTCCLSLSQNRTKKGGLAAGRFAPAFGLILGLENAALRAKALRWLTARVSSGSYRLRSEARLNSF